MTHSACPLDCFDTCSVVYDSVNPNKLVASNIVESTNGCLCPHLNKHFFEAERIKKPMVNGEEVSMSEALNAVAEAIKDKPWLLWRGSGNLGLMQEVTNFLVKECSGVLTHGSLCDGAGDAAIRDGRGVNKLLSLEQISKADVVVVWGRNITVTNSHIMPYIKDKDIVVIDPVKTKIAKMASLHIQVKPRSDFYLAILLSRFLIMEDAENAEWLEERASEWEDFYEFTRSFRIKAILEYIGLSLNDIGDLLVKLQSERVVFLVGVGVQHYEIGYETIRAIDALASILGLFGKEGCGVSFLSDSKLGFDNPFKVKSKTEPIAITPFSKYKSVIIQGGNPAQSMPCSSRVKSELESVENLIYFGLYECSSSKLSNIIIPAKNFLEKEDVRLSYGHQYMQKMNKAYESEIGINEYDFTQQILKRLDKKLIKDEAWYIDFWINQAKKVENSLVSPIFEEIPYKDGFGENGDEEFEFIDDFYDDFEDVKALKRFRKRVKFQSDEMWLLTPKSSKTLNSQFSNDENIVYIPKIHGFSNGDNVLVKSIWGELKMIVKVSLDLRDDCILIRRGVDGVNVLTPPISSIDGAMACYGDVKVKLEKL